MSEFANRVARPMAAGLSALALLAAGCGKAYDQPTTSSPAEIATQLGSTQPNERHLRCDQVQPGLWMPLPPVINRAAVANRMGLNEAWLDSAKFGPAKCAEGMTFDEADKGIDATVRSIGQTCLIVKIALANAADLKPNTFYHKGWAVCLPSQLVSLEGAPSA